MNDVVWTSDEVISRSWIKEW